MHIHIWNRRGETETHESHQLEAVFVRGAGVLEGQAGEPSVFPRQVCVLVIQLMGLTWWSGVALARSLLAPGRSLTWPQPAGSDPRLLVSRARPPHGPRDGHFPEAGVCLRQVLITPPDEGGGLLNQGSGAAGCG